MSVKTIARQYKLKAMQTLKASNRGIIFKVRDSIATTKLMKKFETDVYKEFQRQKRELLKFLKSKHILQRLSKWSKKTYPDLYEKQYNKCSCENPVFDIEYSLNCNSCGKLLITPYLEKAMSDEDKKFLDKYISGWDTKVKPEKIEKVFDYWYPIAGDIAGNEALQQLGFDLAFHLKDPGILESFKTRGSKITGGITLKTQKDFRNILYKSYMEQGISPYEVEKRIKGLFEETYKNRARTIARTETATAQSEVSYETYKKNKIKKKSWLALIDDKTRTSHLYAGSKEPIPMEEMFDMGNGNFLMFPHDPLGPASEIVNCRCDFLPEVIESELPAENEAWTGE